MSDQYQPKPDDKFTFGSWTVGNPGSDPFGAPVREGKSAAELVYLLAEIHADDGTMMLFSGAYSSTEAAALKAFIFDRDEISSRGRGYERLDQLMIKLLIGTR